MKAMLRASFKGLFCSFGVLVFDFVCYNWVRFHDERKDSFNCA